MDTKWKKWKTVLSWTAFIIGITLLIYSSISLTGFLLKKGGPGQILRADYQESQDFRWYISNRLERLLEVSVGGRNIGRYGSTYDDWYSGGWGEDDYWEWEDTYWGDWKERETVVSDNVASVLEGSEVLNTLEELERLDEDVLEALEEQGFYGFEDILGELSDLSVGGLASDERKSLQEKLEGVSRLLEGMSGMEELQKEIRNLCTLLGKEEELDKLTELLAESNQQSLDDYMAYQAQNKNIRYALVYQGKLLYTNLDALEGMTGQAWDGKDFYEMLNPEEYNFVLWFNRNGDGKTEISKDGVTEDIYGNGVYTEDSRWYVPGYTNFSVDDAAKNAVIFLAAAKEPKLYVVGNYLNNGRTEEYGSNLHWMYQNAMGQKKELINNLLLLAAALLLLGISLIWRKEKKQGDREAARFLGKVWLEIKLLLLGVLLIEIFFLLGRGETVEILQILFTNLPEWYEYGYGFRDIFYLLEGLFTNKVFLISCFWVIYLAVLDIRFNKGKQRKPLIDGLRTRELRYPLQKRLVWRYNLLLLNSILALLLIGGIVITLYVEPDYIWIPWEVFTNAAFIILILLLLTGIITGIINWKRNRQMAEDIGALADQIHAVKEGDLTNPLTLPEDADLRQAAENLNEIQHGLEAALREQMQSERMKVDLVTNVSHDIKTPLTSIVSYVELLKQEENLPEHVEEFVRILDEKSERLNTIVQDVFEISKATSGQLPITMEELDYGKLLRQTLADMAVPIEESGLIMKVSVPEAPVMIRADGQRLYRVFQNLIQNALKYSLAGSRIYLTLTDTGAEAVACIKNTSGTELNENFDFTERFARGDESRTDGGSGLGLSIARSFTEACGGSLQVEVNADLFTVSVTFPKL